MQHDDPIEILSQASDHLAFAEQVLARSAVDDDALADIQQNSRRLRDRIRDPSLYVAIVGEFNAGKSSFINALLRDDLLVSAPVISTAAEIRMQHGQQYDARARLVSGQQVKSKAKTRPGVSRFLAAIEDQINANQVEHLVIAHPAEFLAEGVTVIDTPGLNADVPAHEEIAVRAVQHADAVIVVMPADRPLPNSLLSFLKGPFLPMIHRTVFVVTKIWMLSDSEQAQVIRFITDRLVQNLDIADPLVLKAAPRLVVEAAARGEADSPWLCKFIELEACLISRLRRERSLAIAETCLRISGELFTGLQQELQKQLTTYRCRQAEINQGVVQDIDAFSSERRSDIGALISRSRTTTLIALRGRFNERLGATTQSITAALASLGTDDLRAALGEKGKVPTVLSACFEASVADLTAAQVRFMADIRSAFEQLVEPQYREVYTQISAFGVRLPPLPEIAALHVEPTKALSTTLSNAHATFAQRSETTDTIVQGAFWAAAVAGTILSGGFFAFVIGGLAGLGGSAGVMGLVNKGRNQKLVQKLTSTLKSELDSLWSQTEDSFRSYAAGVQAAADAWINAVTGHYGTALAELKQAEREEATRLAEHELTVSSDIKELRARAVQLEQQTQRLVRVASYAA